MSIACSSLLSLCVLLVVLYYLYVSVRRGRCRVRRFRLFVVVSSVALVVFALFRYCRVRRLRPFSPFRPFHRRSVLHFCESRSILSLFLSFFSGAFRVRTREAQSPALLLSEKSHVVVPADSVSPLGLRSF